jgi:hypothetical protein
MWHTRDLKPLGGFLIIYILQGKKKQCNHVVQYRQIWGCFVLNGLQQRRLCNYAGARLGYIYGGWCCGPTEGKDGGTLVSSTNPSTRQKNSVVVVSNTPIKYTRQKTKSPFNMPKSPCCSVFGMNGGIK